MRGGRRRWVSLVGRDPRARDSGHRMGGVPGVACQWQPGQRRSGLRDQQGDERQRRGSDERRCRRRRAHRRQARGSVGDLPSADVGPRPGVLVLFANGAWSTRGVGTVGGKSSAARRSPGRSTSTRAQDGEAPSIDFAGAGRTVPWATWYENTSGTGFDDNNVFASRFDNTGDANQGKWIFAGQSRGNGGSGPNVPSLNIHTKQERREPRRWRAARPSIRPSRVRG